MAKKRKPHSRAARDRRLFSNVRTWMWESEPTSDPDCDFLLHTQAKAMLFGWSDLTTPSLVHNIFDRRRNWVICGRALCRSPDGTVWMEQADMTLPDCRLLEVRMAYVELRKSVLAENRTDHVFDCGWIAQTWLGKDPTSHDPDWVYHDAPPGFTCNARVPTGLGYTPERWQRWQSINTKVKHGQLDARND